MLAANVSLNVLGLASFSTSSLAVGSHTITAFYSGAPSWGASSGSTAQVVSKATTTTSLVSSDKNSSLNQNVTFTATVEHGGAAVTTGTVTFREGATVLAGPLALNASGKASFSKSNLTAGNHSITAVYSGTPNQQTSSDTITQNVHR